MLKVLLSHQWKEATRSSVWQKNLAINLVLGFFMLILLLYVVLISLFLDKILEQLLPGKDPVAIINGVLLYYFLLDLALRFFMQELPVLGIQPYLHLPVGKGKLVHFVLWKSITSLFNFLPLLLFIPFAMKVLPAVYGTSGVWLWVLGLFLLTLTNNFLTLYFKRQLVEKPMVTVGFLLAVVALALVDYLGYISLGAASGTFFQALGQNPVWVLVPLVLLVAVYLLNYRFLMAHTYPEEMRVRKQASVGASAEIGFLQRFGELGTLIGLELKLILRHKRPKSTTMMSVFFLAYGFIFYTNEIYTNGFAMLIFPGIFMTGFLMLSYGQFVPGWQSAHFDALLTKRLSPYTFYLGKFWLFVPACTIAYLVTLLYGLMPGIGGKIVLINTACFLYNIGINTFVVLFLSTYNKKRIDLSKSASFNWQGVGASQFIMMLPALLLPILIYLPFGLMDRPWWGIAAMALVGLLGFIFHRQLLGVVVNRFQREKYAIAAGFRQA
ncbi:DUF5687 family protein [Rufibacter glacialis]|uniref:DUF5687 family protein n=1 Tax=Rufibacter glacialis TaxID=1259555 RepID=A0A5M8QC40_9BACT|nr:DUF5687 family protein [Rufibacter glacialis]KAA6433539.1 hypothetical protein FOE74_13850 [Rufibacter glacialis]GGK73244.1 hypothetical protein GCM10011405_21690 [Rufibacter glacialis]